MELKEVLQLLNGGDVELRPMRKGSLVKGNSYQLQATLEEPYLKQQVESLAADGSTIMILLQVTPVLSELTRSDARAVITKQYGHMFSVEWITVCINGMFEKAERAGRKLNEVDVMDEFVARSTLVI